MAKSEKPKKLLDRHPLVVPTLTIILLAFLTPVFLIFLAAETVGPADTRVVHVYVEGEERTLPTRAKNVKQLLDKLDIKVNKHDVVEPALETEIFEDDFAVNVYRSREVIVVDGKKSIMTQSAAQSPEAIAIDVGLKLLPEDKVEVQVPEDVLADGLATERYVVERATPVTLVLYGQAIDLRTHSKTVEELLVEKEINKDEVTVYPAPNKPLKEGTVVYVTQPGKQIVGKEVAIPFETKRVNDPDLEYGTTKLRTKGREGKKVVLFEIDTKTKKRKELKTVVALKPVDEVTAVGTKIVGGSVSGSKADWMAGAGIDPSQYIYVDHIIGRESGWNPASVSANRCIGLGQRCNPQILINDCPNWQNDPVCQLRHFNNYAEGRYGSWQSAYSFWQVNHWW